MLPVDDAFVESLIRKIADLPEDWHGAGSVSEPVLRALAKHSRSAGPIMSSLETGTGRTTLLLSHLSEAHTVFTKDDAGDGDSYPRVTSSPLLRRDSVEFVIGPTQRMLLARDVPSTLDLAFIDGPHAYPFPDLEYWVIYPRIRPGGLLVIDDIQIPTVRNLYRVIASDAMWRKLEVTDHAAFFARTAAPGIDPYGEGWWLQGFNAQRWTNQVERQVARVRARLAIRTRLRRALGR